MGKNRSRRDWTIWWTCALIFGGALWAQDTRAVLPCNVQTLMKRGAAYRIATPRLIYINCDDTNLADFDTAGRLRIAGSTTSVEGVEVSAHLVKREEPWIRVELKGRSLDPKTDYELDLAPSGQANVARMINGEPRQVPGPFRPATFKISTISDAAILPSVLSRRRGTVFRLVSSIGFCDSGDRAKFAELGAGTARTFRDAVILPPADVKLPKCGDIGRLEEAIDRPSEYGQLEISPKIDHAGRARIEVTGVQDIFGQKLQLTSTQTLVAGKPMLKIKQVPLGSNAPTDSAVLAVVTAWSGKRPSRMSQVLADWWMQTAPGSSHSTLPFDPGGIADLIARLKTTFPNSPVIDRADLATGGGIQTVEDLVQALSEPRLEGE